MIDDIKEIAKRYSSISTIWYYDGKRSLLFGSRMFKHMKEHFYSVRRIAKALKREGFDLKAIINDLLSRDIDENLEQVISILLRWLESNLSNVQKAVLGLHPLFKIKTTMYSSGPWPSLVINAPILFIHDAWRRSKEFVERNEDDASLARPYSLCIPNQFREIIIEYVNANFNDLLKELIWNERI